MKKAIKALFVLLFLILAVSVALAAEKKNKSGIKTIDNYIAVFDFEVKNKNISRPLADRVIRVFSESGKYKVIDREKMNKILKERKFKMSGCVAQKCKVEAGQILGVGKIVNGSVRISGKTCYLTLQLIDVKTGKKEISVVDKCKCQTGKLLDSTTILAKKLLGKKVEQPVATATKPELITGSKTEAIAKAKAEQIAKAKAEAEEIARAKTEADELARQKAALELEKQELERQKVLDAEREQLTAERRKIEAERQQLTIAKRPSQPTTGETARDGRFVAYSNGTVSDTRTNLMWAAKDNGSNINWVNAKSYCENYRGGGYTDWRMPTQDELAGLYDVAKTYKSDCAYDAHLTELIRLTCSWAWASETSGSGAAFFNFGIDLRGWGNQSNGNGTRALPVRSGK